MERIAQSELPAGIEHKKLYSLDSIEFKLIPEDLPQPMVDECSEIDYQTASDIYRRMHKLVYHAWPTIALSQNWEAAVANAKTASMGFTEFVTFALAGYKLTHPFTPFYPSILASANAAETVYGLRRACLEKFNVEDAEALGMVLDIVLDNIDESMVASEIDFGAWIVGTKLRCGGNSTPQFYSEKELGLNRYWLALEPTYHDCILRPYLKAKFGTVAERKHRHLVLQEIALLKRRSTLAATVFNTRTRIMPKAVKTVLLRHGLTPKDFTYPEREVYESFPFWNGLGLAVQHLEVLKAVLGQRHTLWR